MQRIWRPLSRGLVRDAMALSSGTIASLIGDPRYAVIDQVQERFVAFCQENVGRYTIWQEAWQAFEQSGVQAS